MAEEKNPISERVKKMAAVLAAVKKVSEDLKKEEEAKAGIETVQSSPPEIPRPS